VEKNSISIEINVKIANAHQGYFKEAHRFRIVKDKANSDVIKSNLFFLGV